MDSRYSIFNEPERAAARIAAMEAECERLGLRLVKRLLDFKTMPAAA